MKTYLGLLILAGVYRGHQEPVVHLWNLGTGQPIYIPRKPGKYGIEVWACCDMDTAYCCNLEVYTGKQGRGSEVGQSTRVVLQMMEHLSNSGHGCTSFPQSVADVLLNHQMTFCEQKVPSTYYHSKMSSRSEFQPVCVLWSQNTSLLHPKKG